MSNRFHEFFSKIDTVKNRFTQVDQTIADYLIKNVSAIPRISSEMISKDCFVSKASISRFCNKIGYAGFNELKYKIKEAANSISMEEKFKDQSIFAKLYKDYDTILERHKYLLNEEDIYKSIDLLVRSTYIYIVGIGNSGFSALDFSLRLSRFGFKSMAITDGQQMMMQGKIAQKGDMFIAISASGTTKEIVSTLQEVRKKGLPSILISNYNISVGSKCASLTLLYPKKNDLEMSLQISNQLAPLFIVDVIISYLLSTEYDKYIAIYNNTLLALQKT